MDLFELYNMCDSDVDCECTMHPKFYYTWHCRSIFWRQHFLYLISNLDAL